MPNINFELNLNKHPKDVPNRGLVWAENVQLSNDLSCLQSEFAIKERSDLQGVLTDKYIAGYIPCNKEFILFLAPKNYVTQLDSNHHPEGINIQIYRYREQGVLDGNTIVGSYDNASGYICYNNFLWHGGKLKGTFTYNIKSHLIIAVAESDTITGELIPLKTINLGKYGDTASNLETDLGLNDDKLSLNPKLSIPRIIDYNYKSGLSYKGWYNIFIRYKINSYDYTKWYHIGYPIFVDELEKVQLLNYFVTKDNTGVKNGWGITDFISSGSNTCNKTIELTIDHRNNNFNYYQIGIIISSKDDAKGFKSLDLNYDGNSNFYVNISSMEESSINEFVFQRYNYYDVKNLINYKNRLYASNYKETDLLDTSGNYLQQILNKLRFKVIKRSQNILQGEEVVPFTGRIDIYFYNDWNQQGTGTYTHSIKTDITGSNINTDLSSWVYLDGGGTPYTNSLCCDVFKDGVLKGSHRFFYYDGDGNIFDNNPHFELSGSDIGNLVFDLNESTYIQGNPPMCYAELNFRTDYNPTQTVSFNAQQNYHIRLKESTLIPGDIYNLFIHFVNKYGEHTDGILVDPSLIDTRIYDENDTVVSGAYTSKYGNGFMINNSDRTVKYDSGTWGNFYLYGINVEGMNNVTTDERSKFVGFFLSYEKVQKVIKFNGYVTPYNFKDYDHFKTYYNSSSFTRYWDKFNGNKYRFYCADIDLLDNLEFNFKYLRLEKCKCTGGQASANTTNQNPITQNANIVHAQYAKGVDTSFDNSANIDEKLDTTIYSYKDIEIVNAALVIAHNFAKNNQYRGSYIELTLAEAIPSEYRQSITEHGETIYFLECKGSLLGETNNLYLSNNKVLIKFSDVCLFTDSEFKIRRGFNGHLTYNNTLIYNNDQVVLNTGYNILLNSQYYSYIDSELFGEHASDTPPNPDKKINTDVFLCPVANISLIVYSDIIYDSKCFKTLPEIIVTRSEAISDKISQTLFEFENNTVVLPMNTIDLFKERFGSQDSISPITYVNFISGFVTSFDKRLIRSNPIADESFENSWRIFSPEAYKDITENKGNISNIIALGTTVLVHTEHGLFMFDRDNTLQNGEGESIQLNMPDVFDVDYKEVIASQFGSCGLQDSEAWVLDEFGYIFYDNDAHRFYKFGQKSIDIIDLSIGQFVDKYKPFKVRFVNDAESNRLLVNLKYKYIDGDGVYFTKELTLSYNYKINKWISTHIYSFDRGFNTKQMTYFILDFNSSNINYSKLYLINRDNIQLQNVPNIKNLTYNQFENVRNNSAQYYMSTLAIMVNDGYELIKTLEYISWKLYKIQYKITDNALTVNPREITKTPYSGYQLRVYNDECDTGILNILIDTESNKNTSVMNYKKPWWELGNWNFNYLRNIKNASALTAKFMSRLHGNYFIINLWFGDENQRIEFETLDCKLIKNITI